MRIRWTETALRQLGRVPSLIGENILRGVRAAADYPLMYPERRRGRYQGCRWFLVDAWLVFYRIRKQTLIVQGIWHGARRDA